MTSIALIMMINYPADDDDDKEVILGTLSKDDDDGSEKDGKKMNLRSFKLNRVCLDPLNMSNAGDFSWS